MVMWQGDALAHELLNQGRSIRAHNRANVPHKQPDGERRQVGASVDVRVDLLGRRAVDGAVGKEDEEDADGSDDRYLSEASPRANCREDKVAERVDERQAVDDLSGESIAEEGEHVVDREEGVVWHHPLGCVRA